MKLSDNPTNNGQQKYGLNSAVTHKLHSKSDWVINSTHRVHWTKPGATNLSFLKLQTQFHPRENLLHETRQHSNSLEQRLSELHDSSLLP